MKQRAPTREEAKNDVLHALRRAGISKPKVALLVLSLYVGVLIAAVVVGLPILMLPATIVVLLIYSFGTS